uniref:Uncharacterized protein n=1 Tax=Anguilla anguilla TaxID=7936 RepID=A0A0E9UK75_ANGAN
MFVILKRIGAANQYFLTSREAILNMLFFGKIAG